MDPSTEVDVGENLKAVRARIAAAAKAANRDPASVTLVAISKTFDAARIVPALAAGQRVFGENRVQEAAHKWPALRERDLALHLVGPLQTNKIHDAVELFDVIESVDRPKVARALAAAKDRKRNRVRGYFLQVNTGAEPQKHGVLPEDADAFVNLCRDELGLAVMGLMCIPPADQEPAPHFALLREIARRNRLAALSMGMSADFETAILFGATYVRVGTAIFGARAPRISA